MEILHSLQKATKQFDTGDKPLLFLCSDLNEYVCKYALGGTPIKLIFEFIAASFLNIWEIKTPDFKFLSIDHNHVKHLNLPKRYFEFTSFGSKYGTNYQDLNMHNSCFNLINKKNHELQKMNLLKIILFDIWIANEDRSFHNLNLLVDTDDDNNIVPIDHGAIFNSGEFVNHLTILTENETLVNSDLYKYIFDSTIISNKQIKELKDNFYLCTDNCKQKANEILKQIPHDWAPFLYKVENKMYNQLFSNEWIKKVFEHFCQYI